MNNKQLRKQMAREAYKRYIEPSGLYANVYGIDHYTNKLKAKIFEKIVQNKEAITKPVIEIGLAYRSSSNILPNFIVLKQLNEEVLSREFLSIETKMPEAGTMAPGDSDPILPSFCEKNSLKINFFSWRNKNKLPGILLQHELLVTLGDLKIMFSNEGIPIHENCRCCLSINHDPQTVNCDQHSIKLAIEDELGKLPPLTLRDFAELCFVSETKRNWILSLV